MGDAHVGKGVVVTGGASGIGRACVERFVRDGARVVIADLDVDTTRDLERQLDGRAIAVPTNVTDEAQVLAAVDTAVERFGRLDVMVNNAGIISVSPLVDTTAESWRRILDVNVVGVALGSKAAARRMIDAGTGGVIVNASSGGGRHGVPNFSQYCATKAAIIMLSQSLAIELAPEGIRVNCYTPGHIMTPFWEQIVAGMGARLGKTRDETLHEFLATIPWGRFGTPDDVANAVAWLASDDAEFVSGQCIAMNGAELPW